MKIKFCFQSFQMLMVKYFLSKKIIILYITIFFKEGTGDQVGHMDSNLLQFIKDIDDENSTIMFLSDHGLHMQGLFFVLNLDIVRIELVLPTLMMKIA